MIQGLNRGNPSGSPDGGNSSFDFVPEQSAVNRRNEKGSIQKRFHCPCNTCKVNRRAKQNAVSPFNFLNPFIDRIIFDGTGFILIFHTSVTGNASLDFFFADKNHFSLNTCFFQFCEDRVHRTGRIPFFPGAAVKSNNFQFCSPRYFF